MFVICMDNSKHVDYGMVLISSTAYYHYSSRKFR
jgi:hypothetical protein